MLKMAQHKKLAQKDITLSCWYKMAHFVANVRKQIKL